MKTMLRPRTRLKRRAGVIALGGFMLGSMAGDTIQPWESAEAARYGSHIQSVETQPGGSRKVTFTDGKFQIWDERYQMAAKKAYIAASRPDVTTKCYATGCNLYIGGQMVKISSDPNKLFESGGGSDIKAEIIPNIDNFLTNLLRPDPTPSAPIPSTGFVPFDQYKYGEMRDGQGNLIQSGPVSPGGSSFDYRYYQQNQQGANDAAVINQYIAQPSVPSRPVNIVDEVFGPNKGEQIVCKPTGGCNVVQVPQAYSASKPSVQARPTQTSTPSYSPSNPAASFITGSSPYSSGIPSLFDSPLLQQYLNPAASRTPIRRSSGSIVAPLVIGVAVLAVGIFLLTRK